MKLVKRGPNLFFKYFYFLFGTGIFQPLRVPPEVQKFFDTFSGPLTLLHPKIELLRYREPTELETLVSFEFNRVQCEFNRVQFEFNRVQFEFNRRVIAIPRSCTLQTYVREIGGGLHSNFIAIEPDKMEKNQGFWFSRFPASQQFHFWVQKGQWSH